VRLEVRTVRRSLALMALDAFIPLRASRRAAIAACSNRRRRRRP
jgi:hypothetical protein